jgi:hypothetical protein
MEDKKSMVRTPCFEDLLSTSNKTIEQSYTTSNCTPHSGAMGVLESKPESGDGLNDYVLMMANQVTLT